MNTCAGIVAALVVSIVLSACGGGSDSSDLSFPPGHRQQTSAGQRFVVEVKSDEVARQDCGAIESWPASYPDEVVFDAPGQSNSSTICVRGHISY